jgi:hypothetical protein
MGAKTRNLNRPTVADSVGLEISFWPITPNIFWSAAHMNIALNCDVLLFFTSTCPLRCTYRYVPVVCTEHDTMYMYTWPIWCTVRDIYDVQWYKHVHDILALLYMMKWLDMVHSSCIGKGMILSTYSLCSYKSTVQYSTVQQTWTHLLLHYISLHCSGSNHQDNKLN